MPSARIDLAAASHAGATPAIAWLAIGISALTDGRIQQAIEALERCAWFRRNLAWQAELIEAYLRAGRVDAARRLFSAVGARCPTGPALRRVGRCRVFMADEADAETAFEEALRLCDGEKWPLDRARCQLAYGEQLRRNGRRVAARVQLRDALEGFERIGAATYAERARQELRASGETARARASAEPEQLTPQELQIALLVAKAATNREAAASVFLSAKTVEKHLSSAYRKLGVRSRTELARRLADR